MPKITRSPSLVSWIERYIATEQPRSKSLIITVFGDAISPFSEGIWLGELIKLMEAFSVNERLVRTSAFRLADEGWLSSRKEGRRSFYSLTDAGTRRFESAYKHIYQEYSIDWDGKWTLVVLQKNIEATTERSELRKELEWNGFSLLSNGIFLHPLATLDTARQIIERNGYQDLAILFRAESAGDSNGLNSLTKIRESWNLEEVEHLYRKFINDFTPVLDLVHEDKLSPLVAFQLQTLMIHSFRRANLHDPLLPTELLPENWPHTQAYEICKDIYKVTCEQAHAFLSMHADVPADLRKGNRLNISVVDRFK
ncbi:MULTISPECIES: phenylacetic acid degradation operon negative regulatory protein PaaX [Spongiibacter]|uniref:Phenylacetic acid degradation operon negative regulatory protein PaaX n=1 Tax=Spongiibacter thalassae TaxID=2721624 RepID=A0ABX1GHD1_9GAMM|nr:MULTISPECIES: phenylacetic acid degradation operon negative regulatory protein PaaX [Spongiibacter]NKI18610.1 phenylacetic acid degradation operon negative regulatory protein PaaX [Spongiibacter thalassae]